MDETKIFETVRSLIADCLFISPEEITREKRLFTELGADSLDFLDLVFKIERVLGVKMQDGELDFLSRLDFSSPAVMQKGFLTRKTVERLHSLLPALQDVSDPERVTPADLFSLITVDTLCQLLGRKLG